MLASDGACRHRTARNHSTVMAANIATTILNSSALNGGIITASV
jgi:hypothetical protein